MVSKMLLVKRFSLVLMKLEAGGNKPGGKAGMPGNDTDAVNVKQLEDTVASQTLTHRATTAADADAKSVKFILKV